MLSDLPSRDFLNKLKVQENIQKPLYDDVDFLVSRIQEMNLFHSIVIFSELMKEFIRIIAAGDSTVANDYQSVLDTYLNKNEINSSEHDRFKRGLTKEWAELAKTMEKFTRLKYGDGLKHFYDGYLSRQNEVVEKIMSWKQMGAEGEAEIRNLLTSDKPSDYQDLFQLIDTSPASCRLAGVMSFNLNLSFFIIYRKYNKAAKAGMHNWQDRFMADYKTFSQELLVAYDQPQQIGSFRTYYIKEIFTTSLVFTSPFLFNSVAMGNSVGMCFGAAMLSEVNPSGHQVFENMFYELYKSTEEKRTLQAFTLVQELYEIAINDISGVPSLFKMLGGKEKSVVHEKINKVILDAVSDYYKNIGYRQV